MSPTEIRVCCASTIAQHIDRPETEVPRRARDLVYLSTSPSKKSVQRLKMRVGNLLAPGNNDPWPEVRDTLNRSLLGCSATERVDRRSAGLTNTSMSACATSSSDGKDGRTRDQTLLP